jgi:hypothetical protein
VEELATQAGLPIFGDGVDDVSWLEKRSTPPPPPPPFEKPPERPLFAPEPPEGGPARRARPGAEQRQPSGDDHWPFGSGATRSAAGPPGGGDTGTGAGLGAVPDDEEVPGRSWLRLAAGIAAGLLLLVAVVVAFNLGRGKTLLGAEPEPDPSSSAPSKSATPKAAPVMGLTATDLDPQGEDGSENPEDAPLTVDGDPLTAWTTVSYEQQFGPAGLKTGVGLVVDLHEERQVTAVDLTFTGEPTGVELYLTDAPPTDVVGLEPAAADTAADASVSLELEQPTAGRYLAVWLTRLPAASDGGFRGGVAEVQVEAVDDGG